jgi:hypothetical protein
MVFFRLRQQIILPRDKPWGKTPSARQILAPTPSTGVRAWASGHVRRRRQSHVPLTCKRTRTGPGGRAHPLVGQRMRPDVGAADALKLQYIECILTGQGNKIKALCEKIFALHLIMCIRTIIILPLSPFCDAPFFAIFVRRYLVRWYDPNRVCMDEPSWRLPSIDDLFRRLPPPNEGGEAHK